jgi:hypothetical protein
MLDEKSAIHRAEDCERVRSLVEWLAEKVMGWRSSGGGIFQEENGKGQGIGLDSWKDSGMVWERAREMGLRLELRGYADSWEAIWSVSGGPWRANTFSSGPRAISEAVALATGWKEPEHE